MRPDYAIVGKGPWPDWMAFPLPLPFDKAMSVLRELLSDHCE